MGKRMRFGVGEEKGEDGESGFSTVIPVVLGDNGDAIIGAGKVCRLNGGGVRWCSVKMFFLRGVWVGDSAYCSREDVSGVRGVAVMSSELSNFIVASLFSSVGVPSSPAAVSARARSSHLSLTRSQLAPTRWPGVHLRVGVPVGELRMALVDCEPARDRDPLREDVRSSKRFWYANGAPAEETGL